MFPGKGLVILAIILASDKTHLTNFSGDKVMYPVYLSLGNIEKGVRAKLSSDCWVLFAKIPVSKFAKTYFNTTLTEAEKKGMPALLRKILFHECLRHALAPLRIRSIDGLKPQEPRMLLDAHARVRLGFSVVLGWCTDLEEHQDILGLARYSCPKCLARFKDLDTWVAGEHQPCGPRTSDSILNEVLRIRHEYPKASTWQFKMLAKTSGLSGVERFCWEGHWGDFCRIVALDDLHGIMKALKDHLFSWIVASIGADRVDAGLIAQPHRIGLCNFPNGITHISQFSGRENRDLQRHIIGGVIGADGATPALLKSLRGALDFSYTAQLPMHTDRTLRLMQEHLAVYNKSKYYFIQNRTRTSKRGEPHMRIPKAHNWEHFAADIRDHGTLDNTSTETGETLHKKKCKRPYALSNRKDPDRQILDRLMREEIIDDFARFIGWQLQKVSESDNSDGFPSSCAADVDLLREARAEEVTNTLPGIRLAKRPHYSLATNTIAAIYDCPDFVPALHRYFVGDGDRGFTQRARSYTGVFDVPPQLRNLDVWQRFSLERRLPNKYYSAQPHIIHCRPPLGARTAVYDTVLVEVDPTKLDFVLSKC